MPHGETEGYWITTIAFFAGIGIDRVNRKVVPMKNNPHEMGILKCCDENGGNAGIVKVKNLRWRKIGFAEKWDFSLRITMAIHDIIISRRSGYTLCKRIQDASLGISIAIAIAIHNMPKIRCEPFQYYQFITALPGKRSKAFSYSFLSGLSEPLGMLYYRIFTLKEFFSTILNIRN